MSVVVIGDRAVGKTSFIVALAQGTNHVQIVSNAESLIARRFNADKKIAGTSQMTLETLLIHVSLPSSKRQIHVLWIDTPGEAFSNRDWKVNNLHAWRDIQQQISESRGVILLLPPHRDIVQTEYLDERTVIDELPTTQAWLHRFKTWLDFLKENCSQVEHILICIHRADTFCDLQLEGKKWRYDKLKTSLFYEYSSYIRKTYFLAAEKLVREYNASSITRGTLQFFITTTDNPYLLELPWIYLGAFLANS